MSFWILYSSKKALERHCWCLRYCPLVALYPAPSALWSRGAWVPELPTSYGYGYISEVSGWSLPLPGIEESSFKNQFPSSLGNRTPCAKPLFGIGPKALFRVCPKCYEFCELGRAHSFLGIVGWVSALQRKRNQCPNSPSCGCNIRLLEGILEACTTLWRYTQWRVASSRFLCKTQNQQASQYRPLWECSLAWYLCDKFRFGAYGQLTWVPGTSFVWPWTLAEEFACPLWPRTYSCPSVQIQGLIYLLAHHTKPPAKLWCLDGAKAFSELEFLASY